MNSKIFEYQHKDIPTLKKDILFRCLFGTLFLAIFIWQFISLILVVNSVSVAKIILASVVLFSCVLMVFLCLMYAFKDFRIINAIKLNGKCVSSVELIFKTNKTSFINLYSLIMKVIALVTTLVLLSSLTYSLLQIAYFSTVSFYLPFLLLICVSGFNSVYHINGEIKIQKTLQRYNAMY